VFEGLKKTWQRLRHAEPGKRFQDYNRIHQTKHRGRASGLMSIVLGVAIITVGIVALPAPGPGVLIIAIGAAFIARESLVVARFLDWFELWLRAALARGHTAWKKASPVQRVAVAVAGFGMLGLAVYFAYSVTLGA